MRMNPNHTLRAPRTRQGFSLVELMVGVAVGLIGLLVVFKTLAVWDSHTRTTTAGGDAQMSGTIAMFSLERDIRLAGMGLGLAAPTVMGCSVTGTDTVGGRALTFPFFPVQIVANAVAGAPDQINVLAGNSPFFATAQSFTTSSATTKKLDRRYGFRKGDVVVVAGNATATPSSADCRLVQITDTADPDGFTVSHASGTFTADVAYAASAGASSAVSQFNAGGGTGTTFTSGTMYNLGPQPELNRWSTDGRVLSRLEYLHSATALGVSDGVINLKAEYGVDVNGDNIIADDNTEWTSATPTDWTRVRAIRVALLVRSSQFEKAQGTSAAPVPVTPTNPTWTRGDGTTASFLMTNIDGSADSGASDTSPNNWRFYRYTVYEKVVPLRNMIWGTSP